MNGITILWMAAAVSCEVLATSLLKVASLERPWALCMVIAGYTGAFTFLSMCLQRGLPIAVAYAVWSAAGTSAIALIGWIAYQQRLSTIAVCGLVLTVAGVALVNLGIDHSHS